MLDIAKQHRLSIDLDALSHELGCPVVGVVASREDGIEALKDAILTALENPVVPRVKTHFDERIERAERDLRLKEEAEEAARRGD